MISGLYKLNLKEASQKGSEHIGTVN